MLHLLRFLGRDPDRTYHVREIAEESGVSIGASSLTLRAMHGSGLVDLEERGAMKFYRFNLMNPVAREFKVLFNIEDIKDLVDKLQSCADRVVLFGSCARGTDSKDSDVDLFVSTRDPSRVKDLIWRHEKKIQRSISPVIVPPGGLTRIRGDPLFEQILQGRVLLPQP